MGLMQSKKGIEFIAIVTFFTFILLIFAIFQLTAKTNMFKENIGETQQALFNTYEEGEKTLYYIDQSAKFASYEALNQMAKNGGLISQDCQEYLGYALWANKTDNCMDFDAHDNYFIIFSDQLDLQLIDFHHLPKNNYFFSIFEGELVARAKSDITLDISKYDTVQRSQQRLSESILAAGLNDTIWPLDMNKENHLWITSCFGNRDCEASGACASDYHPAIDIDGDTGDPVFAIADGKVISLGENYNTIAIDHGEGVITRYMHNSKILVSPRQEVSRGDVIAYVGGKGPKGYNHYPDHLHFELEVNGQKIDPLGKGGIYNITDLGLKRTIRSNCYYYADNYAYWDGGMTDVV